MALKDIAALYGRIALVIAVFAFVAGIIAAPLLSRTSNPPSLTAVRDGMPAPQLIRVKSIPPAGRQG